VTSIVKTQLTGVDKRSAVRQRSERALGRFPPSTSPRASSTLLPKTWNPNTFDKRLWPPGCDVDAEPIRQGSPTVYRVRD
jgi:hypothetical protein